MEPKLSEVKDLPRATLRAVANPRLEAISFLLAQCPFQCAVVAFSFSLSLWVPGPLLTLLCASPSLFFFCKPASSLYFPLDYHGPPQMCPHPLGPPDFSSHLIYSLCLDFRFRRMECLISPVWPQGLSNHLCWVCVCVTWYQAVGGSLSL